MPPPIHILVAEDHQSLRQIISNFLGLENDMIVVGQASNGDEALELVRSLHPEVVIMDYEFPEKGGVCAIREILALEPRVAVIGFSAHESGYAEQRMLEAGAAAYVSKNEEIDQLLYTIRQQSPVQNRLSKGETLGPG